MPARQTMAREHSGKPRAYPRSARRRLGRIAVVVALAVVAFTSCSGDDSDGRPDSDSTTSSSIPPATTETPRLEQRPADVELPISFTAGDVVFELTKVEFSNATPGTYLEAEPELIDDELLYVTFTARVDSGVSAPNPVRDWPAMAFKVVTSDGRVIAASGVDFTDFVELDPAAPETTTAVVFPATDDDLAGARFRLDDGVNPPAEVALVAPPPAAPDPESPEVDSAEPESS